MTTMNNTEIINDIEKLSVKSLKYKKMESKKNTEVERYVIFNNLNRRVRIICKNVIIPFGYESFNDKIILNLEITKKNNEHHNIYSYIRAFEKEFDNHANISSPDVRAAIEGKGYSHNMRKSKGGYIIRSQVIGHPKIHANNGMNIKMTSDDIKNTMSNVTLDLVLLWINDTNYSITWNVVDIEICYSFN